MTIARLESVTAGRHASLHPELGTKLTPSKLRALDLLAEQGGLRVGELAERVGVDDTTATRLVDKLEELGLAAERPQPGAGRALTALARAEERAERVDGRVVRFGEVEAVAGISFEVAAGEAPARSPACR